MSTKLVPEIQSAAMSYLTNLKSYLRMCGARTYSPRYPIEVLRANGHYYIGQTDSEGLPYSRLSEETWGTQLAAESALASGHFHIRLHP